MRKRFETAFSALLGILLITLACLAFMPWPMDNVVEGADSVKGGIVVRYENQNYNIAYPDDAEIELIAETLTSSVGYFDRNRSSFVYDSHVPLYRIYLWNEEERIPEIWVSGEELFYDQSQFVLDKTDAVTINAVLASCFS